jgi:hypothetical protein
MGYCGNTRTFSPRAWQATMLKLSSRSQASLMSNVAGKTSNGYTYEGNHHPGSSGRVNWTATYRLKGEFAGIRHGLVHDMLGVSTECVDDAVKCDIESVWTDAA